VGAARLHVEVGRLEEAKELAREALAEAPASWGFNDLAWVAAELGCVTVLHERLERVPMQSKWVDATRALLSRDFATAAAVYDDMGVLDREALARLRAAEQLVADGRRAEADEQLRKSLAFWRSVGATRYLRQGEALLARTA
jgi:tetratricopeptide (TPR) repeat protein